MVGGGFPQRHEGLSCLAIPATAGMDENGLTQIMGREDRNHGVEFETTSVADLVFYTVHVVRCFIYFWP